MLCRLHANRNAGLSGLMWAMLDLRSIFGPCVLALAPALAPPALHAQGEEVPFITSPHSKSGKVQPGPAQVQVEGLWCGAGFLRGTTLALTQRVQEFEGVLARGDRKRNVDGLIEGAILRTSRESAGRAGELVLELEGERLRIVTAGGPLRPTQGMSFVRASGSGC